MKPTMYGANVSNQDQEWLDHLTWMIENRPTRTWELFQGGKLREYLDKKAAREIVYNDLIAPPVNPENPGTGPTPLTEKQQSAIETWQKRQSEPNLVEISG
jgi:hypothetical protein